jgi:tetratricopeptide (TPR) repeat protein
VVHNLLGRVLLTEKKYDRAIAEFKKILEIDPGNSRAHYLIGMTIVVEGKKELFPQAEGELQGFLKTTEDRLWRSYALYWLGMLYEKQGSKDSAKKYYEEAIALNGGLKSAKLKLRGLGGGI